MLSPYDTLLSIVFPSDTCRRKKVRCDGLQPSCTNCTTFGFQCTFNDSAKKRGPPKGYIEALENRLHRMENLLGGLVQSGVADRSKLDMDSWKEEPDDDVDILDSLPGPGASSSESPTTDAATYYSHSPDPEEEDILAFDKDARIKINALSDSMDSMALDDGGIVRYLGNSSGIDLLQKNQLLKNGYLMVPVKFKDHQDWLMQKEIALAQLTSEMPLPPRDLADHLIELYFTFVHPNLPIVHKPTFMRQYQNPDPEKRPPMVLLNAIFAIASRFSEHPEIIGDDHDPDAFGDEYFSRAKRIIDIEYELPRQAVIQALLMMVLYRFTSVKSGGRVWVMLGMATRMAQDLGMHRSSARWQLPPLETEIRKRLWWACYIMDRWVSAAMGRPMAIDDTDCDVEYPSAVEHDWAEYDEATSSPRENGDKSKSEQPLMLRYFIESIKLSRILGQILRRVYAATTRNHGPSQVSSAVAELDTMLTKWLLALPADLKYDHQAVAAGTVSINRWAATIHSSYYSVLILLHRPYMVPTSLTKTKLSESMPSFNICVSAANSITYLTDLLTEDDSIKFAWNFTTFEAFTASLIHLTNSASLDNRLQTQARKNLVKSIAQMKRLGTRWFNAAKFSVVLEDLMCAHLNFEEYKPEGRSMEPVIITKFGETNSNYPIILRDQNHPSGGTLLYAPKSYIAPTTPTSTTSTPGSSPATSAIHHPEHHEIKQEPGISESPLSKESTPGQCGDGGSPSSQERNTTPSNSISKPAKKSRKAPSQRNSLLFQSSPSSSPSPTSISQNISAIPGSGTPSEAPLFAFSSLTTPGMFVQGQAFMDYEQMVSQHQQQLQHQQ
ncbi:hypothetical protein BGW38_000360, partial [Lunasporangiospora selenospora]